MRMKEKHKYETYQRNLSIVHVVYYYFESKSWIKRSERLPCPCGENRATTRDEAILLNVVISIGMSHEGRMRITLTFLFTLHRVRSFCNTISIAELQTRLLNERWGYIINRRMIISRLKRRMYFLCAVLRARFHRFVLPRSKSALRAQESFVHLYFQSGDCRIYSINRIGRRGGITQSDRTEVKRIKISCNSIPFASILFRGAEIFAEHFVIRLYSGIGNTGLAYKIIHLSRINIVLKFNIYIRLCKMWFRDLNAISNRRYRENISFYFVFYWNL